MATCTVAVPFRPPDGRAAVADKLPHYAYAAYAPPKFAAGSPCSQPLKTLYFVRFLASFLTRYIYVHTSSVSPSFSRLLTYNVFLSLSRLPITFLPRASSSRGQLPRTLYFLLPVWPLPWTFRSATYTQTYTDHDDASLFARRIGLFRLLFMEVALCVILGWRLIETRIWWFYGGYRRGLICERWSSSSPFYAWNG